MTDKASFDPADIQVIYGDYLYCVHCGKPATDAHHVVSRGYNAGIRPNSEDREIMSSVLNFCSLCRTCHSRGDLHRPVVQRGFLQKALRATIEAVERGDYTWQPKDDAFRKLFKARYTCRLSGNQSLPYFNNMLKTRV